MIYTNSRYADGAVLKALDPRTDEYRLSVYRVFPKQKSEFYLYTWVQGDRIDLVANLTLGSPSFWWKIMDLNPEIIDPFDIPINTTIRIPSA
jgi:hypothetical protein